MRIYKDGKLVEVVCDRCGAKLKPGPYVKDLGPHVKDFGWTRHVLFFELDHCQDCTLWRERLGYATKQPH